jgi:signal transduction histidine kinase/CheY-like chemotaxis protein
LNTAKKLNLGDFYIAAYFSGQELHAPQIRDSHRDYIRNLLYDLLQQGQLTLKGTENCTYLCNLARAIYTESQYVSDTLKILEPDYIAFDLLHQVEQKRQQRICAEDEFLVEEGKRLYAEMILADRYLQYRYPELTSQEKYLLKIRGLNELQAHYPDRLYFQKLEQLANEWKRQGFIMALNSGRIAHNSLKTVGIADQELEKIIDQCLLDLMILEQAEQKLDKKQLSLKKSFQQLIQRTFKIDAGKLQEKTPSLLQTSLGQKIDDILSDYDSPARISETIFMAISNRFETISFSIQFSDIKETFSHSVESYKAELDKSNNAIEELKGEIHLKRALYEEKIFDEVIRCHAGPNSEMFQSFRTRIRHGWLIASLKDCFARFDLYNEGGPEDALLTDTMRRRLENLETSILERFETALRNLKVEFTNLIERLDQEWLWLKDEQHPRGMLDFSMELFDLEGVFQQYDILTVSPSILIRSICQQIDQRAKICFVNIQNLLEDKVYQPLYQRLNDLESLLIGTKEQFRTQQGNLTYWGYLHDQIQAARNEFSQRMRDYKAWFDFEESAVRDFTLPEIIQMAWEITTEVDGVKVQHHRVQTPVFQHGEGVDKLYVLGSNFTDLLEIFKILFQNIVYHANPEPENSDYNVSVHLQTQQVWRAGKQGILCRIVSTCASDADITALKNDLFDPEQWRQRLTQKQGTGLATIQETLMHRLQGVQGEIQSISITTEALPTLETPVAGTAWFVVELVAYLHELGSPVATSISQDEAFFTAVSIEKLAQQAMPNRFNILVVEDQEPKYRVLARYLQELLPESNLVHTWDLETSARLIVKEGVQFDLLILDITLPTEPRSDAPLKSLAGLSLLKIMQIRHLQIPTIIVTQYSNWSSEAQHQTRQFIEHLTLSCQLDFPKNFKGAIRFSHTELTWQQELKQALEGISMNKDNAIKAHSEERIDQLRTQIENQPDDRDALRQLANLCLNQAEWYLKSEDYQKTDEYYQAANEYYQRLALAEPNEIEIVRGLILSYVGLGLDDKAQQHLKEMQTLSTEEGNTLRQQILHGQLQYIKRRKQALREQEIHSNIKQIADGVAHQFRTPLQTIEMAVGHADRYLLKGHPEEEALREVFQDIEEQVEAINGLVTHFTRLRRGSAEKKSHVDLNKVIEQAMTLQRLQLSNYAIEDDFKPAPNLPTVYANAAWLEQAFINLITNAQYALKPITDRQKQISITTQTVIREGQELIMVEFRDNGMGVAEAIRSKLFEPFVTTKERGQGMGLGLSIVSDTFSELGGSIHLDKTSDVGTRFIIEIPVIHQPTTQEG